MQLEDFLVTPSCSVIEAMKQINYNGKGVVYVCENGSVLGALTDGDIRRYILRNGDLKEEVSQIANLTPKVLHERELGNVVEVMKRNKLRSIPVLDKNDQIKEIYFEEEITRRKKKSLGLPVVIMAGGKGTRLYPYTKILPKPLIPIGDKTITEHIMERFMEYGCSHFDMVVNYKKNFIKAYFVDNENPVDIDFIEESKFLGTGGGLKLLEGRYTSTFFVSNCDILIEEDYGDILEFHEKQKNLITIVSAVKHLKIPYGTIDVSDTGYAMRLNEKPELSFITNTGMYVLEPQFLNEIPNDTFIHITDIIQKCIDKGENVGVYPIPEERWLDMGQLDELQRMQMVLEKRI